MTMHELFRPHIEGAFWQTPNELPDLRRVGIIALDTEESDEGLRAGHGAGWAWRGGYICGISIAWRDPENGEIRGAYFPIAHLDSKNFERVNVVRWLRDHIAAGVRFIMHNAVFDLGWLLMDLGVAMPPSSQLEDTGVMATTINENRPHFSLAALCDAYDLPGKNETLLIQAIEAAGFKINKKNPPQSYIARMPARVVGPYAEADAIATFALFEKLRPLLEQEDTTAAYRLDIDLLPMTVEMRRRGICVDQSGAEQARDVLLGKR